MSTYQQIFEAKYGKGVEEEVGETKEKPVEKPKPDSLYQFLLDHDVTNPSDYTRRLTIPKPRKWSKDDAARIPTGIEKKFLTEDIVVASYFSIFHNKSLLIYGPAGCGKTTIPEYLCQLWSWPFQCIEFMPGTEPEYHLGQLHFTKDQGTEFRLGDVPLMLARPGVAILDEIFKADPYIGVCVLQPTLDSRKYVSIPSATEPELRRIPVHKDCRIILTSNTSGAGENQHMYVERSHDKSTLSRIDLRIEVDYLPHNREVDLLVELHKLKKADANKIVSIANNARKAGKEQSWTIPFTTRESKTIADLYTLTENLDVSVELGYSNALNADERAAVKNWVRAL